MAFVLTEEQTMLKDTAAQFFNEKMPVSNLRHLRDTEDETGFDRALWKEMAGLGFAGILIPEEYGGSDFGVMGLGLVLEQAGRTLAASPLFSTALLGAGIIRLGGSEEQKKTLLPAIAAGDMITALALEEGPHHAPAHIETRAEKKGDGWSLNGTKRFVLDGHSAGKLIVVARVSGKADEREGLALFLVDPETSGVSGERRLMVDNRNAADITLTGVQLSGDAIIGSPGGGADILEPVLDQGRVGMAAEMLGGINEVFDRTIEYLKDRQQFGVPIGSFQALKHRAAEMFCEVEICRSVVLDAMSAVDERRNDIPQMASLTKARLGEASRLITNEGVQMHGGIGMTDEVDMGLFMKRARVQATILGDVAFHCDRYGALEGF
ncbi:MAG: acyl-CoA dehydrogenase family protein [Parvularculales bacterium]